MRILFLAYEVAPYSKTGGLADVAGALPTYLRSLGNEVITVTPRHRQVSADGLVPDPVAGEVEVQLGHRRWEMAALSDPETGVRFLEAPDLYDRPDLYTEDEDEGIRFAAFGEAALALCRQLGWRPDVIHCNDWQTGLVPLQVKGPYRSDPFVGGVPTVLTIHNLGYQGRFPISMTPALGLYGYQHLLHQAGLPGDEVAFLATGILYADLITTVSPTYAEEIQTPEAGAGLDHLLRSRADDLVGILNGIDTSEWNPRTDPHIPFRYSERSLWRKERDKEALCERLGLRYRRGVPVVGIISRLVSQKGFDIARGPLVHFLDTWDLRLVVLGSGEARYEELFRWLASTYPDAVGFVNGYDIALSHLIEAGSDIFLMPSLYEPCGLNQMYSLAYATAPVVRRVGGLADTVAHFDSGSGTGFVFEHYTEDGLGWALGQALTTHTDRRAWKALQLNAMAEDNSWERRASGYEAAYRRAVAANASRSTR